MTTELNYLVCTAILTTILWVPVVVGYLKCRGMLKPEDYKRLPEGGLDAWVVRANRAHVNAVENFAPFAAVVLVAHVADIHSSLTVFCAAAFFYLRLAHAIVFIAGISVLMLRTVLFALSFTTFLVYAIAVLMSA